MASTWRSGLLFGLVVSALACADALRLDIPAGSNSGPGSTGSGGGGTACRSNSDCADPKAVCDTVKSACVECLSVLDCAAKPGTVCSKAQCVCGGGQSYCGPNRCADFKTSQTDCGSCGHACFGVCNNGVCADAWEPVGSEGAPEARSNHVAVWTGSKMIVWGGISISGGALNSGGIYDPATFKWTATSVVGAPSPRHHATAVWTGTKMIVWGGQDATGAYDNDGAMFDPMANTWTAMSGSAAPSARANHVAQWGTKSTPNVMVIWGGSDSTTVLANGGRFDPAMNAWTQIVNSPNPNQSRERACSTWESGADRVFIYGGHGDDLTNAVKNKFFPDGAIQGGLVYLVNTDSWTLAIATGQPSSRADCTVTTDGMGHFYVFGGVDASNNYLNTGATFDGVNTWQPFMAGTALPAARHDHTAVMIGAKMIIFGGRTGQPLDSGAIFDTATNTWVGEVPRVLSPRFFHTAVAAGDKMIVWGGQGGGTRFNDGGIYTVK